MPNKYIKGYIHNGTLFVTDKAQVYNAKNEEFVEGTGLIPFKEAHWIVREDDSANCSDCNFYIDNGWDQMDYCPKCGAEIDFDYNYED